MAASGWGEHDIASNTCGSDSSASRNWRFAMKMAHCAVLSAIIVLTALTGSYMTLATGIQTMRAGRATEQSDCQTELNDSRSGHFRATT
jgi:hypothetical protein